MKLTAQQSSRRMLTKSDKHFFFTDGITVCQRAGMIISDKCPPEYKTIILEATRVGWVEPVAFVSDKDLVWAELKGI